MRGQTDFLSGSEVVQPQLEDDVTLTMGPLGPIASIITSRRVGEGEGIGWGDMGDGSLALALNILLATGIPEAEASLQQEDFARRFLLGMPELGGTIECEAILDWIWLRRFCQHPAWHSPAPGALQASCVACSMTPETARAVAAAKSAEAVPGIGLSGIAVLRPPAP
jgi:hypothetical protein